MRTFLFVLFLFFFPFHKAYAYDFVDYLEEDPEYFLHPELALAISKMTFGVAELIGGIYIANAGRGYISYDTMHFDCSPQASRDTCMLVSELPAGVVREEMQTL